MTPTDLWTWIAIPALGGIIGWVTNWIAVKMIFRPLKPRWFLFFRLHGLVPRRQADLAKSIGKVVGTHLVEHRDIVRGLNKLDFDGILGSVLDRGLGPKIAELRSLPLIGGFLTEERVRDLRNSIVRGIMVHKDDVLDEVERGLSSGLDVPKLVESKVASFEILKLEKIILDVASRELRSIVVLGLVLGVLIGVGQAALIHFLPQLIALTGG